MTQSEDPHAPDKPEWDKKGIDLGTRLNHLLNQEVNLRPGKPALILPTPKITNEDQKVDLLGSGNVVIIGEPGSGKSTLGLQIAVAAAEVGCDSAYLSLEEEPERVKKKATIFGWESYVWWPSTPLDFIEDEEGQPTKPEQISVSDSEWLKRLIGKCHRESSAGRKGRIIVPSLLPRPLASSDARLMEFFWDQYRNIEFLVRAAAGHNSTLWEEANGRGLRVIVIDSLNMLGVEPQNREMLHRLFDLFRQNRILGVFTVEANSPIGFDSTMGDVVLSFSRRTDSGYAVMLLECLKTRFSLQTRGLHPYKFRVPPKPSASDPDPPRVERVGEVGIVVFPSPHAVVAATEALTPQTDEPSKGEAPTLLIDVTATEAPTPPTSVSSQGDAPKFPFGWGDKITSHLLRSSLHRGNVVALAGPSGTFKTQVALNFLLHGIAVNETVLYLRLRTPEGLNLKKEMMIYPPDLPGEEEDKAVRKRVSELQDTVELVGKADSVEKELESITARTKQKVSVYREPSDREPKPDAPRVIVADFRTGMLMAEEFMDTVRRIFNALPERAIGRVVLDDVGAIGVSYPLLKHSITTGDLFLSAFVHVMRNYRVDLLLLGTTGDLAVSNDMVHQACNLADGVLRTSVGTVFGDKYVLLTGDGMAGGRPNRNENPPVVLLPSDQGRNLTPDVQLLDEFVGFESGRITRPGIVLHLYQESAIQKEYNRGLLGRLRERYGMPTARGGEAASGVTLIPFSPGGITQLGPSKGNDLERPRDHTAVRIVDEFEPVRETPPPVFMRNVLLLAYRSDVRGAKQLAECTTWTALANVISMLPLPKPPRYRRAPSGALPYGRKFCYSRVAPETLACLVLDALVSSQGIDPHHESEISFPTAFAANTEPRIVDELKALHRLMFDHVWRESEREKIGKSARQRLWKRPVPTDAAVYVFWYSQLRELLADEPHLARVLDVRPLPGGGFAGDWYVHVEPSSVSVRLGQAIKTHLCSAAEDYERFRQGLSLPVTEVLKHSILLAWPGASPTRKLTDVDAIWRTANRRSKVKNYRLFNHLLSTVGEVLAGKYRDPRDIDEEVDLDQVVKDLTARLPELVTTLCKAGAETQSTSYPPRA